MAARGNCKINNHKNKRDQTRIITYDKPGTFSILYKNEI